MLSNKIASTIWAKSLWILTLNLSVQRIKGLLLSDLPTPSVVIDVQAIHRLFIREDPGHSPTSIRPIRLSPNDVVLLPTDFATGFHIDESAPTFKLPEDINEAFCFLHCKVTRGREEADPVLDDPASTFLVELDLKPRLCNEAHLVLGLNNHHVGSYYWARSAGTGSSMDAPGIQFDCRNSDKGILRWDSQDGPVDCNSNDGKRSEWVNFLRPGDNVQLLPSHPEQALHKFAGISRVFGVSSSGRPLGSEPQVVCSWKLVSIKNENMV